MPLVTGRKTSEQPLVMPLGSQTGAQKLPYPQLRELPTGWELGLGLVLGGPGLEKQEGDPAVSLRNSQARLGHWDQNS